MPDNIRPMFPSGHPAGDGPAPLPPVIFVMIGLNDLGQPMLQMKTNSLIETLGLLSLAEEIVKDQARKAAARVVTP